MTVLKSRAGNRYSVAEIVAFTEMAEGWFLTAVRLYFKHGKRSLREVLRRSGRSLRAVDCRRPGESPGPRDESGNFSPQ